MSHATWFNLREIVPQSLYPQVRRDVGRVSGEWHVDRFGISRFRTPTFHEPGRHLTWPFVGDAGLPLPFLPVAGARRALPFLNRRVIPEPGGEDIGGRR